MCYSFEENMFYSFFESLKHIAPIFPITFLRVYLGSYYLREALQKFQYSDLETRRWMEAWLEKAASSDFSEIYRSAIEFLSGPQWYFFSMSVTSIEFAIAVSYLAGFVVRPVSLLAAALSLHYLFFTETQTDFFRLLIVAHLTLAWVGAGRVLGFDYFFYKRQRGWWW